MTTAERSQFFSAVYVIQFLHPDDTERTGTALYHDVIEPLGAKAGICTSFVNVLTRTQFLAELHNVVDSCARHGHAPVLHLETHGRPKGLGINVDDLIPWADLRPVLKAMNELSQMNLLVTMAACHGLNLIRTMLPTERSPAWGMLGPDDMVLPSDVSRGFKAFYSAFLTSLDLNRAIDELRTNDHSWPDTWKFQNAEVFFAYVFGHYFEDHGSPEALATREHAIIEIVKKDPKTSHLSEAQMRTIVRQRLQDEQYWFDKYRRHFLLLDLFPANDNRFPMGLEDARTIYATDKAKRKAS